MKLALSSIKARRFYATVLLFALISFLGWCMEKALFLFAYGENAERGFLSLPVCPIYGGSLVVVRRLFGLPIKEGERYPFNAIRLAVYAAAAAIVATAAELLTGAVFHDLFGIRLWSYVGYPREYKGYVCLSMSICWGFLISAAMALVWAPLEKKLEVLPARATLLPSTLLVAAFALDFLINLARVW